MSHQEEEDSPVVQFEEQTEIRERIKDILGKFVACNNEMNEIKSQLKILKETKDTLALTIQDFMKQNSIDILSSGGVKIKYVSKETKKQTSKDKILESVKERLGPDAFVALLEELEADKEVSIQETLKIVK